MSPDSEQVASGMAFSKCGDVLCLYLFLRRNKCLSLSEMVIMYVETAVSKKDKNATQLLKMELRKVNWIWYR